MHLADAEDRVRSTTLLHAAMHVRRLVQFDGDLAGAAAQRLAPAGDARDRLLVHAVLQRPDEPARLPILADQHQLVRAAWRERVLPAVEIWGVAVSLKKKE